MEVRTIPSLKMLKRRSVMPGKAPAKTRADDSNAIRKEILNGKPTVTAVPHVQPQVVRIPPAGEVKATAGENTSPNWTNGSAHNTIRVAAYARVSTGLVEQQSSILAQRQHYETLIKANPEWEFAGVYWESDVSGTNMDRPELQRLIADCERGRVDLILTKSISRFSRNTTDCLEMVRTLTALGVNIQFEKENINTGTMDSEFMLTLFSTFAEEESKSISANETWTMRKQFLNGTYRYSKAPYGFDLVDGGFQVNPEQASIVRDIFAAVLSGKGTEAIARELNARGIPTGTKRRDGSPGVWTGYRIRGMVRNVAYIGDVLYQKTFHEHFKRKTNYGERPQYYNDGHHQAIVDEETFERANAAIRQRGAEKGNIPREDRQLRDNPHLNRYAFSGKLTCACCGSTLRRVTQKTKQGTRYHWLCTQHHGGGHCPMKREQEESIRNAFCTMMNKLVFAQGLILDAYAEALGQDTQCGADGERLSVEALNRKLNGIAQERHRLTLLLSKGCGEPVTFHQKLMELDARESEIRLELSRGETPMVREVEDLRTALNDWKRLMVTDEDDQRSVCGNMDSGTADAFFTRIVDGATVKTGESVTFRLKCGMKLTETF